MVSSSGWAMDSSPRKKFGRPKTRYSRPTSTFFLIYLIPWNQMSSAAPDGSDAGVGDARHAGAELDVGELGCFGDLRDAVDACAVDVPERVVGEQVAYGTDAQFPFEEPGTGLADAGDVFDIVVEHLHGDTDRKICVSL